MADPFIGEIRIFAGNYPPRGWAHCDGQIVPIAQFTALFAIFGTIYGGDGRVNFGLPDLQERSPMHSGNGPGLSNRRIGQLGGSSNASLTQTNMPSHTHQAQASIAPASTSVPSDTTLLGQRQNESYSQAAPVAMATKSIGLKGGGANHENMQPFLTLNFIVALTGLFPSRP